MILAKVIASHVTWALLAVSMPPFGIWAIAGLLITAGLVSPAGWLARITRLDRPSAQSRLHPVARNRNPVVIAAVALTAAAMTAFLAGACYVFLFRLTH
jgi:hypothetical protein